MAHAIRSAFPHATVECRDLLDDVPPWLRRAYPATYYALVRRYPLVWGACFSLLDLGLVSALVQPLRRAWNLLMARRFIRRLHAEPPDLAIATHFFSTDVLSACKQAGWLRAPLLVTVTDLSPHRLWLSPQPEAYVFATAEGARTAERRGVRPDRLHVLGIPIGRACSVTFERDALERLFNLAPHRQTVLVTSGGTTVGPFERVVEALIRLEEVLPNRIQLLVVCGDDVAAVERLRTHARQSAMPVQVFGFIETMPQAMAASVLIVAKAGGLTMTEALGRGVPLVLYHVIPGQERVNAEYASAHGAALVARSPDEAAAVVRRLIEEPDRLAAMREAAKRLSHPEAADAIVTEVITPLLQATGCRLQAAGSDP